MRRTRLTKQELSQMPGCNANHPRLNATCNAKANESASQLPTHSQNTSTAPKSRFPFHFS